MSISGAKSLSAEKRTGREITILENNVDVLSSWKDYVSMELEENFNISVVSNFDRQPLDGASSKAQDFASLISIFGAVTKNTKAARTTLKTAMMSASVWSGSNPISFQFNCTFHVGMKGKFDPKLQVYDPVMKLASLPLPWADKSGFLMAPGLVEGDVVLKAASGVLSGTTNTKDRYEVTSTVYSILIGDFFSLPFCILERAEPVFNKQMAISKTDQKMYPISATINIGIKTVMAGTRDMLVRTKK